MKIMITGADGQLGRALQTHFAVSDCSLVVLQRTQLDITDATAVTAAVQAHQPDFVLNAAGFSSWTAAQQKPTECYAVTRDGAGHLAAACAQHGAVMVQFSSDHVFAGNSYQAMTEIDVPEPQSVLGNSQLEAEQIIRERCPEHLIIRTSGLFSGVGNNIITQTVQAMRSGEPAKAIEAMVFCPTFADHLAIILLGVIRQLNCRVDPLLWGTYHYCDKQQISHLEFVQSIQAQADHLAKAPSVPVVSVPAHELAHWPNSERFCVLATDHIFLNFGVRQRRWRLGLNAALQQMELNIVNNY
jgi:dTDP-4-dehydrorhamnose reductase